MAFDWQKNWPIVAGGAAAVLGFTLLQRQPSGQVVSLAAAPPSRGTTQVEIAQIQAEAQESRSKLQAFLGLINLRLGIRRFEAQENIAKYAKEAQVEAARLRAATEQQKSSYGFFGDLLKLVLPFFFSPKGTQVPVKSVLRKKSVEIWHQ